MRRAFFSNAPPRLGTWSVAMLAALLLFSPASRVSAQAALPLDPLLIPKYVEPLPMPLRVDASTTTLASPLELTMNEFQQKLLPNSMYSALPAPWNAGAYLWCYKAAGWPQTFPGPTLEARVGTPTNIKYVNNLVGAGGAPPVLQSLITVDQTLHWADPLGQHGAMTPYVGPVPAVAHLHGGEVPSAFDGGPDAWWTPGNAHQGPGFVRDLYTYPNEQEATTLWYHDHALGATRLNVYAGLAGFYLLRDPAKEPANLPGGPLDLPLDQYGNPYEREIVIQDRIFDVNGQLFWPNLGLNPTIHPFWVPEFFGNAIMVNGKTWPYWQVEPRRYRIRLLDGSNARVYDLKLVDKAGLKAGPGFWQIGSDGGLLDAPTLLQAPNMGNAPHLIMAPGERCDLIVDFTGWAGKTLTLTNTAKAPYPRGTVADPRTTGQIMQIRVGTTVSGGVDPSLNPATTLSLRTTPVERPVVPAITRALTLNENMGPLGPLEMFVNNTMWNMGPTENLMVGATETWEIINLTADTHPIHLHLVQYQILNRQAFSTSKYLKVYGMPMAGMGPPLAYGVPTVATGNKLGGNPDVTPYLQGPVMLPDVNERGWKDTFRMNPGEVTRVLVRIAPQDANARSAGALAAGMNLFPFDPSATIGSTDAFGFPGGPGYVWHCHIVDHEDNEMMRQFMITSPLAQPAALTQPAPEASELPTMLMARAEPNPARGSARIRFALPQRDRVSLDVYDLAGRQIVKLAEGEYAAGTHSVEWAGLDGTGQPVPEGAYYYRLRAGGMERVQKLVWMH